MLLTKALRKLKVAGILPEPYSLFSPDLLLKDPLSFAVQNEVSGIDLFSKVAGYHSVNANRTAWKLLSPEQKRVFLTSHPAVNIHLRRIEEAYKMVDCHDGLNPYYNAWLYPWEIIKDKLRMRWMFGVDIYDALIIEALTLTKSQVTAKRLWEGEVEWREQNLWEEGLKMEGVDNELGIGKEKEKGNEIEKEEGTGIEKEEGIGIGKEGLYKGNKISHSDQFENLPRELKLMYEERSRRKTDYRAQLQAFNSARKVPITPFQTFFKYQFGNLEPSVSLQEKSKIISAKWKSLSEDEKRKYKGVDVSAKGRIHREKLLDGRTELVMNYIFGGKVEGWNGDWQEWRRKVGGDMYYLDKMYFPNVFQKRKGGIEMA